MDHLDLIEHLKALLSADFEALIVSIPDADTHVSPSAAQADRAAALVRWATRVKRLEDVAAALERVAGGPHATTKVRDGAVAVGKGAVAAGKGGIAIGGNVHGNIIIGTGGGPAPSGESGSPHVPRGEDPMCSHLDPWLNEKHREALHGLWKMLDRKGYFARATGPYPAEHGKKHINGIMTTLVTLLQDPGLANPPFRGTLKGQWVFELGVATLIHDLAMANVALLTADGDKEERRKHTDIGRLRIYLDFAPVEAFVDDDDLHKALLIAWAHAGDANFTAPKKLEWIEAQSSHAGYYHLPLCVRLLRFGDLLDVGPHRLNLLPDGSWRPDQMVHHDKHALTEIALGPSRVELRPARSLPGVATPSATPAVVEAVNELRHEITEQLRGLQPWLSGWELSDRLDPVAWPPAAPGSRVKRPGNGGVPHRRPDVAQERPNSATAQALDAEIAAYCRKAAAFHAHLPVAGFARQIKVPIDVAEIYVPLRAMLDLTGEEHAEFSDGEHAETCLTGHGRQTEIPLPRAFAEAERLRRRGLVILGDPGSGKTTHLLRLLLGCAREGSAGLGLPAGLVPLYLPLRNLRDVSGGLEAFVESELARPHLAAAAGFGRRLLEPGGLLFLLDGLDEVADEIQRAHVARWIDEAVRAREDCRFVVTCRYAGYTRTATLNEQFIEMHLRPMTQEQAELFIRNWYRLVERGLATDPDQAEVMARERAEDLIQGLRAPDMRAGRVVALTRNPLLLTNICMVHRHRNRLPQKRARLYEDCIDVLLEHWRGAKKLHLDIDAKSGRRVLQPAAYWLHGKEGRTRATAEELAPVMAPALDAIRWQGGTSAFLERIRNESGLLTGWDHKHYGFMHLGFQEYLAAREVRERAFVELAERGGSTQVIAELASHFGESWWQEVGLLLLALEEPSLFVPYMREVVKHPKFAENPALVDACLEDAAEVKSGPFVELLKQTPGRDRGLWQRQAAALRVVERLDKAALQELGDMLRKHPDPAIRARFETQREAARQEGVLVSPRGGIELVRIPGGTFLMGSPEGENGRLDWEGPQRRVTLPEFHMARYPVTNKQYAAFLEANPGAEEPKYWADNQYNQPSQPVVGVSWPEASRYAEWAGLRLPTEAEWEYACRASTTGAFNDGSACTQPAGKDPALDRLGWYDENSGNRLHPVGEKTPNAWGLYDMHGNVWEWCADHWHANYDSAPTDGSAWVDANAEPRAARVVRGGCWRYAARHCRCAFRYGSGPDYRWDLLGFRLVLARSS